MRLYATLLTILLCAVMDAWSASRAADARPSSELLSLSLEELIDIQVISVAKKPQKLSDSAAAVFVITQEDIRRSGATSIPELLRMVPGVEVARISASQWAVTARGFNGRFANKLLVLMDGRTIYTPLFSGVFWEMHDTLLEDIERIEVIRGPGATLWGANAVNGIINIITKRAQDTQGGWLAAGGGSEEHGFAGVRYGGKVSEEAYLRAYAKVFERDGLVDLEKHDTPDDWRMRRAGFRLDWQSSGRDTLIVQGDLYEGEAGQLARLPALTPPFSQLVMADADLAGGNMRARWERTLASESGLSLQVYYARDTRKEAIFRDSLDTLDADFQHRFTLGGRHAIVWGLGYRRSDHEMDGSQALAVQPETRSDDLYSAFIQDDITLVPERWRLTLGSKFEHNAFTGFEVQPNARLLWTPHERHTLWAAISRAVRTPSIVEHDSRIEVSVEAPGSPANPGPLPVLSTFEGNEEFDSEKLIAYELGYRVHPAEHLSLDIAAFYNDYERLRNVEPTGGLTLLLPQAALLNPIPFNGT